LKRLLKVSDTSQDFNLYSHFRESFVAGAHRQALSSDDGKTYRYRDLDRGSARLASYFISLGLNPGDRVSVKVEKSPQALCLYLACLRSGLVFHPLNPAYTLSEIEFFIGNAEPSLLVCDGKDETAISNVAGAAGVQHLLTLNADGSGSLMDQATGADETFEDVPRSKDDLAALLYSSGTTGVPKGIMLTHGNLLSNARSLVGAWGFTSDDRLLHALPIFHVHGLFVALGCVFLSGASMRWLPKFNVEQVLAYLPECTVMMGVPTYYTRLLADPRLTSARCQSMRLFISGSAPLLVDTFNKFVSRSSHRILERYGMTETNMNTSNPLEGKRKPGTVGPPLPGVEIRIVDDKGTSLGIGEVGNLQVRGDNVFKGYWKLPEKTAEDFTGDGFFNTGDQACTDEDGYITIVGRSKDMVITGGMNVYPKEVEFVLDELEGIEESAVIGVPHLDFGEAVLAIVVPNTDAEPERDWIINQAKKKLAAFKVPKEICFVNELPRNTMAKVQKNELRKRYENFFD
jgi:malonyl-CoA/methylmalonyl-CoA synthetase